MSSSQFQLEKEFCPRCCFLMTNYTNSDTQIKKEDLLKLDCSSNCNFCFGLFDINSYRELMGKIKYDISLIDHVDFKLSMNFTPIFEIIHQFWRYYFSTVPQISSPSEIDVTMIKTVFKQLFADELEKVIHESQNTRSDLEIEIIFEFDDQTYTEINNMFKYINKTKFQFKKDIRRSKNINIKNELKNFSQTLLKELFIKFGLDKLREKKILEKSYNITKESAFLKGYYLKLSRNIGQTRWEINGVKVCPSSVEEEISKNLKEIYNSDEIILSAGGREDRDVRMLGQGRPFMVEIINPKKYCQLDAKTLEKIINDNSKMIRVEQLDFTDRNHFSVINKYATNKKKWYICVAWTEKSLTDEDIQRINTSKDLQIKQKTPFRVMHRRTIMDRDKEIYSLNAEKINEHFIVLKILSSAGTYIKEFVHSDLGRTNPSLSSILGCECDILQLDVLDLILDS